MANNGSFIKSLNFYYMGNFLDDDLTCEENHNLVNGNFKLLVQKVTKGLSLY